MRFEMFVIWSYENDCDYYNSLSTKNFLPLFLYFPAFLFLLLCDKNFNLFFFKKISPLDFRSGVRRVRWAVRCFIRLWSPRPRNIPATKDFWNSSTPLSKSTLSLFSTLFKRKILISWNYVIKREILIHFRGILGPTRRPRFLSPLFPLPMFSVGSFPNVPSSQKLTLSTRCVQNLYFICIFKMFCSLWESSTN